DGLVVEVRGQDSAFEAKIDIDAVGAGKKRHAHAIDRKARFSESVVGKLAGTDQNFGEIRGNSGIDLPRLGGDYKVMRWPGPRLAFGRLKQNGLDAIGLCQNRGYAFAAQVLEVFGWRRTAAKEPERCRAWSEIPEDD